MPRFLVRTNCEYSIAVEAETAEEAIDKAYTVRMKDWHSKEWAEATAEEDYYDEPMGPGADVNPA